MRQSAEKIAELLSNDFTEFCSSGKVYNYKKGDIFDGGGKWKIVDFSIKHFSTDALLATYKVIKYDVGVEMEYSLRSSIWKLFDGQWKMIFHQGTVTNIL